MILLKNIAEICDFDEHVIYYLIYIFFSTSLVLLFLYDKFIFFIITEYLLCAAEAGDWLLQGDPRPITCPDPNCTGGASAGLGAPAQ